ncbi:amino acid permease [Rathayibacter tritici]|uniref:L-asparagine permease n=1 Tax=Rathayibacter tritici TaxID=33888 RepID=A0A160KSE0_9MICO|nr:amino acid permease [Rathayibacter tritici]AND16299.1 L-asparagine permease [Rathayibacter tritici]
MTQSDDDLEPAQPDFSREQEGYRPGLKPRQLQMIAIGGAIGTGLFLGAGGRLASAGPSLVVVYAVCGGFAYLILRALGELVLHRPSSGSFISYAREFLGEKAAFVAGWMYFLNWAMTAIADVTAVALYVKYWSLFSSVPQWLLALIALVVVLSLNLVSVKVFGELEFWFALIKVTALVVFLVIGVVVLAAGWPLQAGPVTVDPGISLWKDNGGVLPGGLIASVLVVQGVVFAYSGVELVGTAAGETAEPAKVIPRAINSVILRIAVFYVGSVLLLTLLLPYTAYSKGESPFVTFFSSLGDGSSGEIAGSIMNFVVLTAALSSINAGLYSTGRILRSMALNGSAPAFTGRMNKQGVPYGGILLTASITLVGIVLNLFVPAEAFEIVLNVSALGIVTGWGIIVLCQMQLQRWAAEGRLQRPSFRMPGAPVTSWITLAFLVIVVVLIAVDFPTGTWTVGIVAVIGVPALFVGWNVAKPRILSIAAARDGFTGAHPVIAARPASEAKRGENERRRE